VIDLGISKMALIGAVALIVIGPEKLPRVARTLGALLGKAQRYVADVKAEVGRSIELDELKKMKETMEGAARDVESSVQAGSRDLKQQLDAIGGEITEDGVWKSTDPEPELQTELYYKDELTVPEYKHPKKKWRTKMGATPNWYKARNGVRTRALSGAARVARYRPKPL
jgi:sec-independent protein translocase protein TatB